MKWRKTLAALLALVMTLQSVPALAAEPEKPTEAPVLEEEYQPEKPMAEQPAPQAQLLAAGEQTYRPYPEATYELKYAENNDGTLAITGYTGTAQGELRLPESIGGKTVTSIRDYAFSWCSGLTGSLTIPDSVTSIGTSAFSWCSGLTGSLVIPDSLTSIGNSTFSCCSGFTGSLTIPDSVTSIEDYAFDGCSGLTGSLTIPDSVTSIGAGAFKGCSGFTGSLTIPTGVTSISDSTFRGCSNFTGSLTIPVGTTKIGEFAFEDCSGFTGSLIIPENVTSIGSGAFGGCSGFTGTLTIPTGLTNIREQTFSDCSGLTGALKIPTGVTRIGNWAFSGCSGFTGNLKIPVSVRRIGGGAFGRCSGFTGKLIIPANITEIESSAFSGCSGFTGSLTIPTGVTYIGYKAFYGCSGFTGDLTIPGSVTTIAESAFENCSGFTGSLTIRTGVTDIQEYAFSGCHGFTGRLTIPDSVTSIGDDAFYGCSGFTGSLTIPDSVTSIGWSAFSGCSSFTGSLEIPDSVTSIGGHAFQGCSGFTGSLTLPAGVTSIGSQTFKDCSGFTGSLKIPSGVTKIEHRAFYGCSGFTGSLKIPASMWSIENSAFVGCSGLTGACFLGNAPSVYAADDIGSNSFDPTLTLYYKKGTTSWTESLAYDPAAGTWNGYKLREWLQNEVSVLGGNTITVNGPGEAAAVLQVLQKGSPLTAHDITVAFNDTQLFWGATDRNGVLVVPLPDAKTVNLQISIDGTDQLDGASQTIKIVHTKPSFKQTWEGALGVGAEVSLGAGGGAAVGAASFEATAAKAAVNAGATGLMSLENAYDNGSRTLELIYALSPSAGIEFKSGIEGTLPGIELAPGEAHFAGDYAYLVERGLKIQDYDPANWSHLKQVGSFAVQMSLVGNRSVVMNKILDMLDVSAHNQYHQANTVTVDSGVSLGKVEISGQETSLLGAGGTMTTTYTVKEDRLEQQYTRKAEASMDLGAGTLKEILPGTSGYLFGCDLKNALELAAISSFSGVPQAMELTMYDNGKQNISWFEAVHEQETTFRFEKEGLEALLLGHRDMEYLMNGRYPVLAPKQLMQAYVWMQEHPEQLDGSYTNLQTSKMGVDFKFPVRVELGVGAEVEATAVLSEEVSYEDENGVMVNSSCYGRGSSQLRTQDLPLLGLNEILEEPINAAMKSVANYLKKIWGSVKDGAKAGYAAVKDTASRWWVKITSPITGKAALQSYPILCVVDPQTPDTDAAVSMTLGDPYEIAIYADEAGTTPVSNAELAASPVPLTLSYTPEMLAAAGAGTDANVNIYWFDPARNLYVCQTGCVQDKTAHTVTLAMTKNGEYILATDNASPLISDFAVSDHTALPTITVLCSDLSGFSAFRFCIDGQELVNLDTMDAHYNETTGLFTYQVEQALSAGEHTVTFLAADSLGNANAQPFTFTFTVDNQAPVIEDVRAPELVETAPFTVSCQVTEDQELRSVTAQVRAGERKTSAPMTLGADGRWTAQLTEVAGMTEAQLTILAADTAGNKSQSSPMALRIAVAAPQSALQLTTLQQGGRLVVHAVNPESRNISGLLICAGYDGDGRMVYSESRHIALTDHDDQQYPMKVNPAGAHTWKLFLVDDNHGYLPLSSAF